jgi:hypothetical protein
MVYFLINRIKLKIKRKNTMYELKEIPGFEDYFIDNDGNVFSNKLITKSKIKRNFKQLKTQMFNGYKIIGLVKDGSRNSYFVHRLVALTFLGEPSSPDLVVNHKDGNRLNNIPENLEWVTQKENVHHYLNCLTNIAADRLNKKLKLKEEKEFNRKIICIETGEIFDNQISVAKKYGVTKGAISNAIRNATKTCGYHFCKYSIFLSLL